MSSSDELDESSIDIHLGVVLHFFEVHLGVVDFRFLGVVELLGSSGVVVSIGGVGVSSYVVVGGSVVVVSVVVVVGGSVVVISVSVVVSSGVVVDEVLVVFRGV